MGHARTVLVATADDATALALSAYVVAILEADIDAALDGVERALAFNANSATVLALSARVHACAGRDDVALDHAERSIRLSPFDPMRYHAEYAVAHTDFANRRYTEAVDTLRKTIKAKPRFPIVHALLITSLM